ncbi:MAG: hypothetical protein PF482_08800, partial [Desulfobacteraceae bacterium]|nr:hypothetical protein [Desulfobacteraceae bacterium]
VSAKAGLSFPNVSIGNPVMCYSEHRFRLSLSSNVSIGEACRNDIVLAETMTKARISFKSKKPPTFIDCSPPKNFAILF